MAVRNEITGQRYLAGFGPLATEVRGIKYSVAFIVRMHRLEDYKNPGEG